jgi:hypothetical protein
VKFRDIGNGPNSYLGSGCCRFGASLKGDTGNGSAGEGLLGPVMVVDLDEGAEEPLQFAD